MKHAVNNVLNAQKCKSHVVLTFYLTVQMLLFTINDKGEREREKSH